MNNLNVFADAKIPTGTYDNIRVFGSADVNGDVAVTNMNVYGSARFKGKSEIKNLKVFGSCSFKSYTIVKDMDIKGSCTFYCDVKVDLLKIYGSVDFKEKISRAKEVIIYGDVDVNELESDRISIKGFVDCKEQLNGETIEITTNSGSRIKEIVGSNIVIKPNKMAFFNKINFVDVELIEGDDIELEYVNAKVVRGTNVIVGKNCNIGTVEYTNSLEVSEKSEVETSVKL